jgi:hypothetical protein
MQMYQLVPTGIESRDGGRRSATRWNPVETVVFAAREKNDRVIAPRTAGSNGAGSESERKGRRQALGWSSGCTDPHQGAICQKTDVLAVGGPEWKVCAFGASEHARLAVCQRVHPYVSPLPGQPDISDAAAVRRHGQLDRREACIGWWTHRNTDWHLVRLSKMASGERLGDKVSDSGQQRHGKETHCVRRSPPLTGIGVQGAGSRQRELRTTARNPFQFPHDIACRLPALIAILRETSRDEMIQEGRRVRPQRRNRRRIALHDCADQARVGFALERFGAGDHLVEDCAACEDVRASVDIVSLELLRRRVLERAEERPLGSQVGRCGGRD